MPIDLTKLNTTANKENGETRSPISGFSDDGLQLHNVVNSIITSPTRQVFSREDYDKYAAYDTYLNEADSIEKLNRERAENQSWGQQLGRSLGQILENEVVLGTIEGFADLVDAAMNIGNEDDDYKNAVSAWAEELKEKNRERLEIYRKDPNASFAISDFGWWADNFVNVGSTVSLMIPAAGVSKAASIISKTIRADRGSLKLLKAIATKGGKLGAKDALFMPRLVNEKVGDLAKSATMALASRTAENYQEARETYKQVHDEALSDLETGRDKFVENHPEYANMSNEEIASSIASMSANNTFRQDYWMLLMDFIEYKGLNDIIKGKNLGRTALTQARARLENKAAIAALAGEDVATEITNRTAFKEMLSYGVKDPLAALGALGKSIPFNEGIEEGFQGITQERSKELEKMLLDPKYTARAISSYLSDASIWEQAVWGIIGGAVFEGAGRGYRNLKQAISDKLDRKGVTSEYLNRILSDEKVATSEIRNRKQLIDAYIRDMKDLNDGYATEHDSQPFELDEEGKIIRDENNVPIRRKLTQEDIALQKRRKTNDFITNLVLDATEANNYDLLREMINSPVFDKYLKEQGVEKTERDQFLEQDFQATADRVHNEYLEALDLFYNNVDDPTGYGLKIAARDYTRNKLDLESLGEQINTVEEQLKARTDYSSITESYRNKRELEYLNSHIDYFDNKLIEYRQALRDGRISKQAYDAYERDVEKHKFAILQRINAINSENAFIKDIQNKVKEQVKHLKDGIDKSVSADFKSGVAQAITELQQELVDNESNIARSKETVDLLDRQLGLEYARLVQESKLPTNKDEFLDNYRELNAAIDSFVDEKFQEALDTAIEYVNKQENPASAKQDLYTGNLKETEGVDLDKVRKALDILRLGYGNERYSRFLDMAILKEVAERETKRQEENTTVSNGTQRVDPQHTEAIDNMIGADEAATPPSTGEEIGAGLEEQVANEERQQIQAQLAEGNYAAQVDEALREDNIEVTKQLCSYWLQSHLDEYSSVIKGIETLDETDTNYKSIMESMISEFMAKGLDENAAKRCAIESLKNVYDVIKHSSKASKDLKERARNFSAQLAIGIKLSEKDGKFSITSEVTDTALVDEIIGNFLDDYVSTNNVPVFNGQFVISIENIFEELLDSENIDFETARIIFANLQDYLTRIKSISNNIDIADAKTFRKFALHPAAYFNKIITAKTIINNISKSMHVSEPSAKTKKDWSPEEKASYENALDKFRRGEGQLTVDSAGKSLSVKCDGVEIGYLARTEWKDSGNNRIGIMSDDGFAYEYYEEDGIIKSNFDFLFEDLINRDSEEAGELFSILYNSIHVSNIISDEKTIKQFFDNKLIKKLINEGLYKFSDNTINDSQRASAIAKSISDILFFQSGRIFDTTRQTRLYNQWKQRQYTNFVQTKEIDDLIDDDNIVEVTASSVGVPYIEFDEKPRTIGVSDFIKEVNPVVAVVDDAGTLDSESTSVEGVNGAAFRKGTMGVLLTTYDGNAIIAPFEKSNKIAGSPIGTLIEKELVRLIRGFYERTTSFEDLKKSLNDLIGNPKSNSPLLRGLRLEFDGKGQIYIVDSSVTPEQVEGKQKYPLVAAIYNTRKGSDVKTASVILYGENGKPIRLVGRQGNILQPSEFEDKSIDRIVTHILNKVTFNKSFFSINNKNNRNDELNKYFKKVDGKLEVMGVRYDSYFDFIVQNGCFEISVHKNQDGTYFSMPEESKDIYINAVHKVVPKVEEKGNIITEDSNVKAATDIISKASPTKPASTAEVLQALGVDESIAYLLLNEQLPIFSQDIYYDGRTSKAYAAKYQDGKVYISKRGIADVLSGASLMRLLAHENLHAKLDHFKGLERQRIVNELIETYRQFREAVEKDKSAEGVALNNWLKKNNFYPDNAFIKKDNNNFVFAEEWLVESLTRPEITNYLNKTAFRGNAAQTTDKSLLQKIFDIILKIFGINYENIEKGSILEKQYSIFNVTSSLNEAIAPIEVNNEGEIYVENPVETKDINNPEEVAEEIELAEEGSGREDVETDEFDDVEIGDLGDIFDDTFRSATTEIEDAEIEDINTILEDNLERFIRGEELNTNVYGTMKSEEEFIKSFPIEIQPKMAILVANNTIKHICR